MPPTLTASDSALSLKLDRARWWSLREQPFYGTLACRLTDIFDDATPTACTDGRSIRWGRKFLAALTEEEARFVLLHEALHCAHGHLWRLPIDAQANEACDYAINETLGALAGLRMPDGGLTMPPHFRSLAEEEIYAAIQQQQEEQGGAGDQGGGQGDSQGQGDQPNPCGDFTAPADADQPGTGQDTGDDLPDKSGAADGTGQGPAQPQQSLRDTWEQAVLQAQQAAQACGKGDVPADLARRLAKIKAQPIDWRQEMADFVRDAASSRNDWSRSARRHAWQRVIYPRRRADDLGLIVFARDTSGSVDAGLCAEFSALISQCLADTGARGLVLDCDAAIQQQIELAPGEECPLDAQGGGGTDFRPVFERVAELTDQGERVAGVVYLTDLLGDFPAQTPDVATLWIATTGAAAPFGRIARVRG